MADNFWDTITGLGESAYNYVTDVNFGDSDSQGTGLLEDIGGAFTTNGNIDGGKVASGIGALTSVLGSTGIIPQDSALAKFLGTGGPEKTGYQGKIPTYNASRMQVPGTFDPARRPGSGGQRYFTDVNFGGADTSGQAAALQAACNKGGGGGASNAKCKQHSSSCTGWYSRIKHGWRSKNGSDDGTA